MLAYHAPVDYFRGGVGKRQFEDGAAAADRAVKRLRCSTYTHAAPAPHHTAAAPGGRDEVGGMGPSHPAAQSLPLFFLAPKSSTAAQLAPAVSDAVLPPGTPDSAPYSAWIMQQHQQHAAASTAAAAAAPLVGGGLPAPAPPLCSPAAQPPAQSGHKRSLQHVYGSGVDVDAAAVMEQLAGSKRLRVPEGVHLPAQPFGVTPSPSPAPARPPQPTPMDADAATIHPMGQHAPGYVHGSAGRPAGAGGLVSESGSRPAAEPAAEPAADRRLAVYRPLHPFSRLTLAPELQHLISQQLPALSDLQVVTCPGAAGAIISYSGHEQLSQAQVEAFWRHNPVYARRAAPQAPTCTIEELDEDGAVAATQQQQQQQFVVVQQQQQRFVVEQQGQHCHLVEPADTATAMEM